MGCGPQEVHGRACPAWLPHRRPTALTARAGGPSRQRPTPPKATLCGRSDSAARPPVWGTRSGTQFPMDAPGRPRTQRDTVLPWESATRPPPARPACVLVSHTQESPLRRSAEPGWQGWGAGGQRGAPPRARAVGPSARPRNRAGRRRVCVSASRCHQSDEATRPCSRQQTERVPAGNRHRGDVCEQRAGNGGQTAVRTRLGLQKHRPVGGGSGRCRLLSAAVGRVVPPVPANVTPRSTVAWAVLHLNAAGPSAVSHSAV